MKKLEQEKKYATLAKQMKKDEAIKKRKLIQKRKNSSEETPQKTKKANKGEKHLENSKPQKMILQE